MDIREFAADSAKHLRIPRKGYRVHVAVSSYMLGETQ
jgi:hypothetical protein